MPQSPASPTSVFTCIAGGLGKAQILTQQVWSRTWDPAFLTSSWVILILLGQGPHFKQQVYKGEKVKEDFNRAGRVLQTAGQH